MLVREYKETDIPCISELYYNTVRNINSRDYTQEQVQVWAPKVYPDTEWIRRFDNYTVYVVENEGDIIGFAEFQFPGHIDCFYVHHAWQRRGVGSLLLDRIEQEALHLDRLFVDSSITATPFFISKGFTIVRKQEKKYRGLSFTQYFMEKHLAGK